MSDVRPKFRRKRGLCVTCGRPLVSEGVDRFESGALCREYGEHPASCCKCFDEEQAKP